MKGNGRQVEPQQRHVLHNKRIDTGMIQFLNHSLDCFKLVIIDDGVNRAVDASFVLMGKVDKSLDVVDAVAGLRTCAKSAGTNIDSIGSMLNCLDANGGVAGWGE